MRARPRTLPHRTAPPTPPNPCSAPRKTMLPDMKLRSRSKMRSGMLVGDLEAEVEGFEAPRPACQCCAVLGRRQLVCARCQQQMLEV